MRSQLVHLVVVLCIVLSLTGFARANQSEKLEDQKREFKRLFDKESEPLEPETVKRMLANLEGVRISLGKHTDLVDGEGEFQAQLRLLNHLIEFEAFSEKCTFDGIWLVDEIARHIDKHPALRDYFSDRCDHRLIKSCSKHLAANLEDYLDRGFEVNFERKLENIPLVASVRESLSQVPVQVILDKSWLETKNDQVSAGLYAVMRKHRPFRMSLKSPLPLGRLSSSDFREIFYKTVREACLMLPRWPEILPYYLEEYFTRIGKLDQLDQSAMSWLKLDRLCKSIVKDSDKASDIVSHYKNKQKSQAAEQGQCKKRQGCL